MHPLFKTIILYSIGTLAAPLVNGCGGEIEGIEVDPKEDQDAMKDDAKEDAIKDAGWNPTK